MRGFRQDLCLFAEEKKLHLVVYALAEFARQ